MNKNLFLSGGLLAAILISSVAQAQKKESIEGSGHTITKEVSVQPFDGLSAGGVFNVILQQGSKEQVKIEAEDNLQPLFEVKNEGSTLKIGFKKDVNLKHAKKMNVYVTFKNLKSLNLNSVGNITATGSLTFNDLQLDNNSVGNVDLDFTAQKLNIKNNSVGSMKLSGKAENAVIVSNSVGSIEAEDLVVQVMDIQNEGVGGAKVNAVKELRVKDSFLGKVKNTGTATAKKKQVI